MNAIVKARTPVADMTVAGFGGLPQTRYRYGPAPRNTPVVGGVVVGGVVVPPGRIHFWLAVLAQVQICSAVPLAELWPVASRHLPEPVFTRLVAALAVHFCAPVPLQSQS